MSGGGAGQGDKRKALGRAGEEKACSFLEERGYEILQNNYRSRYGEIDIIARRGGVIAFVEVKARRGHRHGKPFEAVGPRKQDQIRRMALMWVAARQSDRSLRDVSFRFDVISILLPDDSGGCEIEHMEDAFR